MDTRCMNSHADVDDLRMRGQIMSEGQRIFDEYFERRENFDRELWQVVKEANALRDEYFRSVGF